jgi:serine/threonine-protein kinase
MNDAELARTLQVRLESDAELARTIVEQPRATIRPAGGGSTGGRTALASLTALGASLDGKVTIHDKLGEGGMGVVHLATQVTVGRPVALKTLRADNADPVATLRILREAWVTGALEHPNVVPIYDVGVDAQGCPVILMKRIEGVHWGEVMQSPAEIERRFLATDAFEWNFRVLVSVCNAVHFAHSRGILHRDLKPENVMIGSFGEVYVLDWGIAVSMREDPSGRLPTVLTATDVAGTPGYMAPEMLLGDPKQLSPRTDVYLLGAILFEMFAGKPPHDANGLQAIITSILLSSPSFPETMPAEARRICERAMNRDPALRYESAEAFRLALDEYLRHRGSRNLARDAERSLGELVRTLEAEPKGEARTLALFNRLGECRFGFRAALKAWPGNEEARIGLDRALLALVEHELDEGDPHAAAQLLREMSAPRPEVRARVEAAMLVQAEKDARLRKLETDVDPKIGGRTRTGIALSLGVLWTIAPLVLWWNGGPLGPTHSTMICGCVFFLALGLALSVWARESLMKTRLNRGMVLIVAIQLATQAVLSTGASLAGVSPSHTDMIIMLTWSLSYLHSAVWLDRRFAFNGVLCAATFFVATLHPLWTLGLMSLDNFALTIVVALVWAPTARLRELSFMHAFADGKRPWLLERNPSRPPPSQK